jgi:flagellar basal-body rod modification protein FlgD
MSDLISFVPAASTAGTSGGPSAQATLSSNFDTFLTILTAQIQNQDPLEPMDSSKFTEQLVQFSGVEQQIRSNASLDKLIAAGQASTGAALSGYLGQKVEISSAGAQFTGQPINFRYSLPSDAANASITVTTAEGKVVYSQSATGDGLKAGGHDFTWDGTLFGGGTASDQPYYINVVAKDAADATITPYHSVVATVSGVDLTYGEPALTTSAGIYAYSDVRRLMRPN